MSERQTKAGNQNTLSLTLSHSHSHSFTLLFTHSWHAEQLLFSSLCSKFAVYRRKLQCFFLDLNTLSCDIRVHRAGSQLKIIFFANHGHLSLTVPRYISGSRKLTINLLLIFVWFMATVQSVSMHIPGIAHWSEIGAAAGCSPPWSAKSNHFVLFNVITEFTIPLILIIVSQALIIKKLWEQKRQRLNRLRTQVWIFYENVLISPFTPSYT